MGGALGVVAESPKSSYFPETKLEAKMVEAMQKRASKGTAMKSFNTIILKFPKIDQSFRKCKATFQKFDVDNNDVIDHSELKACFRKLEVSFSEEEIDDFFKACDINEDMGIKFNEFIVLLCLVYLLQEDSSKNQLKSRMGLPNLESTFETLVDTFAFLDKNKDGYVSKTEMIQAINETTSGERSSGRIAMKRFEEMDWDRNGMVNFKEFLFAFTRWVGIDEAEDEDEVDEDEAEA
ncbi:probable calcium-binding protein CML21 [Chenopodium quinoa]|uniref:probable calcium-binding protein CML21 n=1 Tax=Chenopodium quinoa TaxID=63459 RepID=UPI000B785F1D|nr:probable calcium-binding protein CML21 [Chenopodium quinoa]